MVKFNILPNLKKKIKKEGNISLEDVIKVIGRFELKDSQLKEVTWWMDWDGEKKVEILLLFIYTLLCSFFSCYHMHVFP